MRKKGEVIGLDVDSSAVQIEGLNWLAQRKGIGPEIEQLTRDSMEGKIPVADVMPLKMQLIAPSLSDVEDLSREYLSRISLDAVNVVRELQRVGKRVVLITGNFHEAVDPLAKALGIDSVNDVFANNLEFNADGSYKGYVENFHLMHDDGKQQVIARLRQSYGKISHIGDSMGDLQAGADIFIGYGGAVKRDSVYKRSRRFIEAQSLAPVLAVELSRRQLRQIPDRSLAERARSGLTIRRGFGLR